MVKIQLQVLLPHFSFSPWSVLSEGTGTNSDLILAFLS